MKLGVLIAMATSVTLLELSVQKPSRPVPRNWSARSRRSDGTLLRAARLPQKRKGT
jgi:hypothetical protein